MVSDEDFDDSDEPPELDEIADDDDDEDDINMVFDDSSVEEEFVEFDPSGRYGRYTEVLGKGAMKTVYRAYDMVDCKEVAWNKARPPIECCDEQATAVQREILLLQGLNHKGIIKLYSAWGNDATGDTDFITELCSSTLLEYRMMHKHISRKAVKSWGRQILQGLIHLHMQNPPIIHRDLKCENILVKCRSNTSLKIGDFGSATFLDETHHMHTLVGTPEFMAPEMFQEDYDELVDVYSFGMCMLELLTRECPYSECKSLGQIYKKVINGEKPEALYRVTDVQALRLIDRCLRPASERPSASELLSDPFLQFKGANDDLDQSLRAFNSLPNLRKSTSSGFAVRSMLSRQGVAGKLSRPSVAAKRKAENLAHAEVTPLLKVSTHLGCNKAICTKSPSFRRTYRVTGRAEDQNILRLKVRIQESSRSCDIEFPFDLRFDSARSVAEEMVRALEYSESDLHTITNLISEEIAALAPEMEEIGASSLQLGDAFPEVWQRGNPKASPADGGGMFGRSSYSSAGKFDCLAEQMARPTSYGETSEEGLHDDNCTKICVSLTDGKVGNSIGGITCTSMVVVSDDKCCEGTAHAGEGRELGDMMALDSDPIQGRDESSAFMQEADEVTSKLSQDKPSASLDLSWGPFNTSKADASVGADESTTWVAGMRSAFGEKSGLVLENNTACSMPSQKSLSRFKQLPTGIGILLRPSSEQQGLRRVLPSCVNAFG